MTNQLARASKALDRAAGQKAVWPDLRLFVDTIHELAEDPRQLASTEVEQFVRETAPKLRAATLAIGALINEAEDLVGGEFFGEEWLGVCERRSDIEWLRTLYADALGDSLEYLLGVENLDDMIRQKGTYEGGLDPSRIPPTIPSTHWWWWYPNPPAARG